MLNSHFTLLGKNAQTKVVPMMVVVLVDMEFAARVCTHFFRNDYVTQLPQVILVKLRAI